MPIGKHARTLRTHGSKTRRQPVLLTPQRAPFPWVKNWVNSLLASSGPSGLLGSDPARRLSPPHRLPLWRGSGDPPEPTVGELAHMAQEARVALPNGCQALKFPSDHTSN